MGLIVLTKNYCQIHLISNHILNLKRFNNFQIETLSIYSSVSDPDPVGSVSFGVSGNVDMDPGSAKN